MPDGRKREYRLIDADTHVNEPPELWLERLPAQYRDRAPRIHSFEEGDAWVLEGVADPINFGLNSTAGMEPDRMQPWVRWEDVRPGGYDPAARVREMDRDMLDAAVLYPTPRLSHYLIATKDPDFHLAQVRAYNDWLSDYAGHAPERLGGILLLPNRGVDQALAEFERAIALPGMVGALVGCYPHGDLQIKPEDDRLWRAIADAGVPLNIHVSMVDEMPRTHTDRIPGDIRFYDAPRRILQFIWGGVFERIPELELVVAEVDIGWVPYMREQIDDRYRRQALGARLDLPAPPSHYLDRNVSFSYITDHYGVRNRHAVGVDRILWSSDYPHVGSNWPHSWRTIAADYSGIPPAERDRMLAGNAQRLYRFDTR